MQNNKTTAVVLCAGKGTRIELGDEKPKCVRPIGGKPMIAYSIATLKQLGVAAIIVVVNPEDKYIKEILGNNVTYVPQPDPKGNAHAVLQAEKLVKTEYTLVVQGDDSAFYLPQTITDFITKTHKTKAVMGFITAEKPEQKDWGRIIRNEKGDFEKIVEKEDLNSKQAKITEVNCGMYFAKTNWLFESIKNLTPSSVGKGEIVMPDLLKIAVNNNEKVNAYKIQNPQESTGINDIKQWETADNLMWLKLEQIPIIREDLRALETKKAVVLWDLDATLIDSNQLKKNLLAKVVEISGGALGRNSSVYNRFNNGYFNYRKFISYISDKTGLKSPFVARELNNVVREVDKYLIEKTVKVLEDDSYNHILITCGQMYFQMLKLENSKIKQHFKRIYYTQVSKDFLFYTDKIEECVMNAEDLITVNDKKRENIAFSSILPNVTVYETADIVEGKLEVG